MGKPIKDRGIRWAESYGDKSAYLKEQMEHQVGPGSYFRWEGHDYTTGSDYYVVVSPGYSKKLGYHFFAGLRKMPADQGASGKKFKTQAEALSYAMRTWAIPRPSTKPAKSYTWNDLVNVPIVLEPQHDKASSSVEPQQRVIVSEMLVEAMSMQGSAHITSNFVPKAGRKTYPEELCWAYKLSPTMGFLSGLYTRKRFMGTDVVNMSAGGKAYNEFSGGMDKVPPSPVYATCEPPTQESFERSTKQVSVDNPLIGVKRDPSGKVQSFDVKPPLRSKEDSSYSLVRWGQVVIKPTITMQPQVMHGTDISNLWSQLAAIPGVALPAEATNPPQGKRSNSPVDLRFEVMPESYENMVGTISQFLASKNLKMMPPVIGNQVQKDLVDIIEFHRKNNKPIDWDTPYYETMKMTGSQLMVYDKLGMPMGLKLARASYAVDEAKSQSEDYGDEGRSYVLANPQSLMMETIFPGYEGPQDDGMTSPIVQFIGEGLAKYLSQGDQAAMQEATGTLKALTQLSQTMDQQGLEALSAQAQQRVQKPMTRADFSQALAAMEDARSEANRLAESGQASRAAIQAAMSKVQQAEAGIRPMLVAFRALAAHNLVNVGPEHVMDSRTCSPVMRNMKSQSYDVDSTLLPTPGGKLSQGGQSAVVWKDHVPPFAVRAKKQKTPGGFAYAGRRYDPANNRYVYGPLPEGFDPYQQMSGMRVSVEDPAMYFPREDGSLYEIQKSVWTRYDPNSRGRAIPGEAYDVGMGPPKESSAKHGKFLLDSRMSQDAFRAVMQKHRVKETSGVIQGVRRYKSAPLFNADPAKNKDAYRYTTSSGREVDLSQNAEKRGQYVYFHDSADLMRMMMMRMGMTEQEFGPFTPLSSEDLKIAYDVMIEGVHYYKAVNHYDQLANTTTGQMYSKMQASQVPPGEAEAFQLFKDGQQARASFDQAKYNYGKVCDACGSGDKISPEVMAEMQKAIQDPEQALSPKPGILWAIEASQDGQSWNPLSYEGPGGQYPTLFGSRMMAELNAGLRDKTVMSREAKSLVEQGMRLRVVPMKSESMTPHTVVDQKYKTRQASMVVNKIKGYQSGMTRDQLEPQREDRHSADYASPSDGPQDLMPKQDEPKQVQPEPIPAEPEPVVAPPAVPEQERIMPAPTTPPMQQPVAPATTPAPAPNVDVDRMVRQWKSQGKTPDDMRARAKAHQGKPYFGDLMSAIDRMSGRVAESVSKLVALADRLDSEGRATDAEAIDRVIRVSMERAKGNA